MKIKLWFAAVPVIVLMLGGWLYSQINVNGCVSCTNGQQVVISSDELVVGNSAQVGPTTFGSGGTPVKRILSATATLDFASAAANTCSADLTVAVANSALADVCAIGVPFASVNAGSSFTCFVSAAGTVTARHCNTSAGANDPASGVYRVQVTQF